ncbi:hypothetical protein Cgig2_002545 [Carnegiea gigantea]|uniref:Uncharacterized protein n=1 Tax=Carnegiea gigantea TaxID=171969 RepID=A0A9Q1QNM3_9CARY|nr:hypothetical protein Cgig2_002545 [Carnegiea gigantea]
MLKKRENLKMDEASASASALAFIEEVTSKCDEVQRKVLEEIISQNIETEYLTQHGISKGVQSDRLSSPKYRFIIFIYLHEHKCAVIFSSGTSKGAPKMIPTIAEDMDRKHMFNSLPKHIMNEKPSCEPQKKSLQSVSHACREGDWKGIIRRLWPNTKYLEVIVTGSMAQYVPALDYYSDGLPKASVRYATSEAAIGINLNPLCDPSEVSYTVIPTTAYFEFIPLDSPCDSPSDLVDLANVQVGKEYEIVVTNYAGLYRYILAYNFCCLHSMRSTRVKLKRSEKWCRYRIGDVVLVTGFHNSSPQLKYARRKNILLSIDADKTDESDLQRAMEKMSALLQPLGTRVVDYTSYADVSTIPGHYVIYLELVGKGNGANKEALIRQCCLAMEEALGYIYRYLRVKGQIGPLEIRAVKNGTFEELMEYATSRGGASINQYKVPRCVTSHPALELLRSHVLSAYFSPSLPHLQQLPP